MKSIRIEVTEEEKARFDLLRKKYRQTSRDLVMRSVNVYDALKEAGKKMRGEREPLPAKRSSKGPARSAVISTED